jgi:hypothetical protein
MEVPGVDPDTFLTYRINMTGEFMTFGAGGLLWKDASNTPVPPETETVKRIPITEHELQWKKVKYPPWAAISNCRGKVNSTNAFGFDPETLLFLGASAHRSFSGFTSLRKAKFNWSLTYRFQERRIPMEVPNLSGDTVAGWNHVWRGAGDNQNWDKLKKHTDTGAYLTYQTADFTTLFYQGDT